MEARAAGLLVAAKRDRFARDVIIAAQLERLIECVGAKLVSTDGARDPATAGYAWVRHVGGVTVQAGRGGHLSEHRRSAGSDLADLRSWSGRR